MHKKRKIYLRKNLVLATLSLAVLTCALSAAEAHQPRLDSKAVTKIEEPEVSKANYRELKGEPHAYNIKARQPFSLYVGILVPKRDDGRQAEKDILVNITKKRGDRASTIFAADGRKHKWKKTYEPFGGDYYFQGPELRSGSGEELPTGIDVTAGDYTITVSSPDNQGQYVLVTGEIEAFPLTEMINALVQMPTIKREFFGKPAWSAYFNLLGLFLLFFFIITVSLVAFLVWGTKRILKKRAHQKV